MSSNNIAEIQASEVERFKEQVVKMYVFISEQILEEQEVESPKDYITSLRIERRGMGKILRQVFGMSVEEIKKLRLQVDPNSK